VKADLEQASSQTVRPHLKLALLLAAAGLVSALFSICFLGLSLSILLVGGVFGACMGVCLQKMAILSNQQTGRFVLVSVLAYPLSFGLAWRVRDALPFGYDSNSGRDAAFPLVLGGLVGGFLVIGAATWLTRDRGLHLITRSLLGALFGALLAAAGRALGQSLGDIAAILVRALPWSFPATSEYQDWYSIFIVWQTGMGLALGLVLGGYPQSAVKEPESR
jgi:hypothetical protein